MAFIPGTLVKADDALNRAVKNALSETFYKASERKEPGYHRSALNSNAIASGGSSEEPSGPWGIFLNAAGYIDVIPGIVWTPGGNMYVNPDPIPAPAETSYIILQSPGFLHSVTASITALSDITAGDRRYWNTRALLGLYDAEKAKLIQYHFSPIVFFLETEDFVIEP